MSRFLCMALTLCLPLQAAWAGKDAGKSSEELKIEGKAERKEGVCCCFHHGRGTTQHHGHVAGLQARKKAS